MPDARALIAGHDEDGFAAKLTSIAEERGVGGRVRFLARQITAGDLVNDVRSALHYVKHIKAGLVRVNGDTTGVDPHALFGGMKGSSSGSR